MVSCYQSQIYDDFDLHFYCNVFFFPSFFCPVPILLLLLWPKSSLSDHLELHPAPLTVPQAPPQDVQGKPKSSESLEITWKPPPEDKQNGQLLGYKVHYIEAGSGAGPEEAIILDVPASKTSLTIENLDKWTQYKVWVAAFTQVGAGPFSDVVFAQTDEYGR